MKQRQILISREEEKKRLKIALTSNKSALIALIGRRRVGKPFWFEKSMKNLLIMIGQK